MAETDAIIGGESSGGMAIRGHIHGKDGIYAAALLVEMLAVTGKSIAEIYREIVQRYGMLYFREADFATTPQNKQWLQELVFTQKELPDFSEKIEKVSYEDGCKVFFADGSWTICRFSGTEPLLRVAAEGNTSPQAQKYLQCWKTFLGL
jgi:phosphomannomutase